MSHEGSVCALNLDGVEGHEDGGEYAGDDALPCYADVGTYCCDEESESGCEGSGDRRNRVGGLAKEVGEEE